MCVGDGDRKEFVFCDVCVIRWSKNRKEGAMIMVNNITKVKMILMQGM